MIKIVTLLKTLLSIILVLAVSSWVPLDFLSEIESRYLDFKSRYPFVQVSLSMNQPAYFPGDSVFFSTRYLYEDQQPVKGSHLIHLEVVDQHGETLQTMRFKVTDGMGYNQLVIRKDMVPGIYRFVAYTDWMRNFGSETFFQAEVPIVSKLKVTKVTSESPLLGFYPEGGHLIADAENRVLVTGTPEDQILITDELGSEIASVKLSAVGTGTFLMIPTLSKKYSGVSRLSKVKYNFPEVEKDGVTIQLIEGVTWNAQLAIPEKSEYHGQELFALVLSQGKIISKRGLFFDKTGLTRIELPTLNRAHTFHQLFILDSGGKEIAQRVFVPIDNKDIAVKFRIAENTKQRQSFTFAVGVVNQSGKLIESDLSLTVYQEDLFTNSFVNTMRFVDLPSVQNWINQHVNEHEPFLNDFLVSKRWERIDWESIYKNRIKDFSYPFTGQYKLTGTVVSKEGDRPAPDSTLVIAYLQKNAMGYEAYTKNGSFEIPVIFDFWDHDVAFITLKSKEKRVDDVYNVSLTHDGIVLKQKLKSLETTEDDPYANYALKRNLIRQSYNYFSSTHDTNVKAMTPNEILEEEFQGVDYTIKVSDFVVFPTMEDMLSEIVTFVQFRKRGSESTVRLFYRYEKSVRFYKQDPLYIIDGVMSTNTAFFLSLKPEDLLTLRIINNPNKLGQLGSLGQNGIIFVETKLGNLSEKMSENLFPVIGLSRSVWSLKPVTSKINSNPRIPDLRSTLYWNPILKTDLQGYNEITLMTSDDAGPMKIKVQGVTNDGRPFIAEQIFTVQLNQDR